MTQNLASPRITYSHCPACRSRNVSEVFLCRDHTVSKEEFSVWECGDCTLRFTQDVPTEEEIGAYYQSEDYVSHSNTSKGLINSLYQAVRNYTIKGKVSLVKRLSGKKSDSLLDVGCGTGEFLAGVQRAGWQVQGLEPDPGARKQASDLTGTMVGEAGDLFSLSGSFQVITMWHVLEHVHRLHEYLDCFQKILAPGGVILIAVPNYTSTDAQQYQTHWAAYDVPRHLYHFSPKSMERLMELHGFHVEQYRPMPFDAFYVSMLSEQYKRGKGHLLSAFRHGFASWFRSLGRVKQGSSVLYVIRRKA